ncbi:MAG TPA: hypothetical protein VMV31_10860 [Terriglobales bacterium]|nr:hypothetical protein [Terriglobales bacterium]
MNRTMKRTPLLLLFCALAAPLWAAPPAPVQALDISSGHWIFHGQTMKTASGRGGGSFTWDEHCAWSPNHLFLQCTFSNNWAGRAMESLVVDTYNRTDHTYWHYEFFALGQGGGRPFVSRMQIQGNTWIEYGAPAAGQRPAERIVYRWDSPRRVRVAIEASKDGSHWTTVDEGVGRKQP